MSSEGSYPTRASRRAERAPQRSRASAGTATAILIIAAIIGFAGGAIAGTNADGERQEPAGSVTPDAGTAAAANGSADDEDDGDDEAGGQVTLNASPTSVSTGGRIDLTGRIEPAVAGVELRVERSLGDTDAWDSFPDGANQVTATTNANGEFSTWVQSSRQGVNYWRMVGNVEGEFVESNAVEVAIN